MGDRELNRTLKLQAVRGLVDLFPQWSSTNTFEQDCWLEHNAAVKDLMDSFVVYLRRLATGDYHTLLDPLSRQRSFKRCDTMFRRTTRRTRPSSA